MISKQSPFCSQSCWFPFRTRWSILWWIQHYWITGFAKHTVLWNILLQILQLNFYQVVAYKTVEMKVMKSTNSEFIIIGLAKGWLHAEEWHQHILLWAYESGFCIFVNSAGQIFYLGTLWSQFETCFTKISWLFELHDLMLSEQYTW